MSEQARGRQFYTLVTAYGVGAAADTAIEVSGSSKSTINYSSASGSYDIVQSDDVFQSGAVFDPKTSCIYFAGLDAADVSLGDPCAGFVKINFATTGKQIVINYIKVNDR